MERMLRLSVPVLLLAALAFLGCPDKDTAAPDKGQSAETETVKAPDPGNDADGKWPDEVAKGAVEKLQKPIDEARDLKGIADDRLRDMTDKLGEQ